MTWFRGKDFSQGNSSNAESMVFLELQRRGLNIYLSTDHWIMLDKEEDGVEATCPDFWWSSHYHYAVYLDGEVHLKKTSSHRDHLINDALDKPKIRYDRFPYRSPMSKTLCHQIGEMIEAKLKTMGYEPSKG